MTRIAKLALIVLLAAPSANATQNALPPRNINDMIVLLRATPATPEQTEKILKTLETPVPQEATVKQRVDLLLERARAALTLGLTDRYLAETRAAWEASGKSHDSTFIQARTEYLGAEVHSGNMLAAIETAEDGARLSQNAGIRLAYLSFIAENKARHGDQAGAEAALKRAETDYSTLYSGGRGWGSWGLPWEANIERARAGVALGKGKFADAERHFRKSSELREKDLEGNLSRLRMGMDTSSQPLALGHFLIARRGFADMVLQQGRLVEAEMLYREIIERARQEYGSNSPFTQLHVEGLSRVLLEQGRAHEARDLSSASLGVIQQQGMPQESRIMTSTRLRLAAAHVALRQWRLALEQYEAVSKVLASDSGLNARLGRGNKDWALTLVRTGQSVAAEQMMSELLAEDSQRFSEDDRNLAETRGYYATALAESGKTTEALQQFRKAVPILLISQKDASEDEATAATQRMVNILEAYLDLLYRLHREKTVSASLDIPAEAFRVADVARGSSVQKALLASAARSAIREPKLAQLARDEQDISHRLISLNDTLSRLLSSPKEQRLDKIIGDIQRDIPLLKNERKRLREQINEEFPEYSTLIDPKPLLPSEVQSLLRADEAMLATYSGERHTYIWGIPKTGNTVFTVSELGREAIAERVAKIRRGLDLGNSFSLDVDFDLDTAHELYVQTVAPVAGSFAGAQHMLVVPHGALGQLPFALLPTKATKPGKSQLAFDAYLKAPWLIRDVAITQLPSVSTLLALRRLKPPRAADQKIFLGFGDPWFNARQASQNGEDRTQVRLTNRSIGLRAVPGTRSSTSARISDLASLPDTATELREIASALKVDAGTAIRLGKAASESAVKESNLADYRIVAFATHGLVPGDLNGLSQPALALSNPELTGETNADGLLTMEEILGLRMNADWVVLSACNTASSDGSSAEAVSGLGRAFFYAGTRALLVTNWPVETVSARLLTTEIFRRQAEQPGISRAQALRNAMLSVMEQKALDEKTGKPDYSYAHPLFWAPYSLIGDGGNQ